MVRQLRARATAATAVTASTRLGVAAVRRVPSRAAASGAARTIKCAASNNLNTGFPHFPTAAELYAHIRDLSKHESDKEFVVRNFVGVIEDVSVRASTVQTELFPVPALEYCMHHHSFALAHHAIWHPRQTCRCTERGQQVAVR